MVFHWYQVPYNYERTENPCFPQLCDLDFSVRISHVRPACVNTTTYRSPQHKLRLGVRAMTLSSLVYLLPATSLLNVQCEYSTVWFVL